MSDRSPASLSPAEELFADWLARREGEGGAQDLESLCREHTKEAADLRRLWVYWEGLRSVMDKAGFGSTDASLADPVARLRVEMIGRTKVRIAQGGWLAENGYTEQAIKSLTNLMGAVKGCRDLEVEIGDAMERLLKTSGLEIRATEEFTSLMKRIREIPFADTSVKTLTKFAEKHAGTRAGARAAHLAALAKISS